MSDPAGIESRYILGMRVDATSFSDTSRRVLGWAERGESKTICLANVHMVMETVDSDEFRAMVNGANLVTPDGMPLVWSLNALGVRGATRVNGPDLTRSLLRKAAKGKVPVGFYGGTESAIRHLVEAVERDYGAPVKYSYSPPFRPVTAEEDEEIVRAINASGAKMLFVGLGCPKQERWISEHRGRVQMPMVAVGAAFDFIAGTKREPPMFVQTVGLAWLFRLAAEPRRLWRRYLVGNSRFILKFLRQLVSRRRGQPAESDRHRAQG